jgi:hypothetical protein
MSEIVRPAKAVDRTRAPVRAYCELDKWSFDPRYTEGRCPICGWTPPGAPSAPAWLVVARKFEWEITGLVMLLVVLVILGVVVASAAGYKLPVFNSHPPPAAASQPSSPARTAHASPVPSHSPAHATPKATPTH